MYKHLNRGIPPPPLKGSKTISLFSQPYLDTITQCYMNIVVVNLIPEGPLANIIKRIQFPPLSPFKQQSSSSPCSPIKTCGYALMSLNAELGCMCNNNNNLMVVDEVPMLISYLLSNGYTVDTSITKMFNTSDIRFNTNDGNKLICFITYTG